MWQGRCTDPRLPPANGKRTTGRGRRGRHSARIRITYTPRPHIKVRIARRQLWALLDSGCELSFINAYTARQIGEDTFHSNPPEAFVNLADGTQVPITQVAALPVTVQGRTLTHRFSVLPNLGSPVLIGTDLRAKLKITLPPPLPQLITGINPAIGVVTRDHNLSPDE